MGEEETKTQPERVKVEILKSFMYNGKRVQPGDIVEFNEDRAVNHMRAGDIKRDESLIKKIKEQRIAEAEALKTDAQKEW